MRRVLWLSWLPVWLATTSAFAQTTTYTNLIVAPYSAVYGQLVTLHAQVRPWCDGCGAPLPTGTVDFSMEGTSVGSAMLYNSATRTFASDIAPGNHVVVANYSGDAGNAPSASSAAPLTVYPASTSVNLAAATSGSVGQALTAFATVLVQAPGGGVPGGEVVVTDGIGDSCTIALPATSCSLAPSAPGMLTLVAKYSGSGNHNPSTATSQVAVGGSTSSVAGSIDQLVGSGLVLHLDFTGGSEDLAVAAGAAGFGFTSALGTSSFYSVTVAHEPADPRQTCSVANGAGVIQGNVANVAVHCATDAYAVGGIVSGLVGSGLVLQINGGGGISVAADGGFAFASISDGSAYAVTVATQPSAPAQPCTVTRGAGVVSGQAVTDVLVTCSPVFAVGGVIGPLDGPLTLQLNGGETLQFSPSGPQPFSFATALPAGTHYAVTVVAAPSNEFCTVTNGSGIIAGADIQDVLVECAPQGSPALTLTVDDGVEHARYGGQLHYTVTLANTGSAPAMAVYVSGFPSMGLDGNAMQWQCTSSGGAMCSQGVGPFFTTADLPPGSSATWIVDVPVLDAAPEDTVMFEVSAIGAPAASDVDWLVLFRDGFD